MEENNNKSEKAAVLLLLWLNVFMACGWRGVFDM